MDIRTTRDLRKFLADVMVDVRNEKVSPIQAGAIAKLSAQINQSLSIEVNAALKQGLEQGAYVEAEPMRLSDEGDREGMVWCEQCDARVAIADAQVCKSPHCKAGVVRTGDGVRTQADGERIALTGE
jgi:Zn finger protein HypA/HybF involved in hydrogenase expression